MLVWALRAHFVTGIGSFGLLVLAICGALFLSTTVAVLYLALEPYVRRHWPQTIISWTRLLHGRWRDPLVGKDVLVGIIEGLVINLILYAYGAILLRIGDFPMWGDLSFLLSTRQVAGNYLVRILWEFQGTLIFFFVLFLLRVLLRKRWLSAVVFVGVWVFYKSLGGQHLGVLIPTLILMYGTAAFVMVRFGLVALVSGFFVTDLLLNLPMTSDFSSWFIGAVIFGYAGVLALALWAFHTSLGGQKLWKEDLLD
jgi:serine/threonine-protein kinase